MKKTEVKVVCGDIAQTEADAIITTINTCGVMSFSSFDRSIMNVAKNSFHYELQKHLPLEDNRVVIVPEQDENLGRFKSVVFVVDGYKQPLRQILYHGLKVAERAGFKSVTIPPMRMDSTLGLVEKSKSDVVAEIHSAVREFLDDNSSTLKLITFVVYKDKPV